MYRYKLEFSTETIDETELRECLEEFFGAAALTIARLAQDEVVKAASPKIGRTEKMVLDLFADHKPKRRKHILAEAESAAQKASINTALIRLHQKGLIERVRHGVFGLPGAPKPAATDIPPMMAAFARPTEQKIMELLVVPRTSIELREGNSVSRQRIDQILGKLIERKLVIRNEIVGERGQHIYMRADIDDRQLLLTRPPSLTNARARVLSALPPETICYTHDVADTLGIHFQVMGKWCEQLSGQGLVTTFKLAQRRYVGITPRGLSHPQYDSFAPKSSRADLVADFGPKRLKFLQALCILGEVRTIDVTYALPEDMLQGVAYGSGNVIQRLTFTGLIERVSRAEGKQPAYRLTPKGRFAVSILNKLSPPPAAEQLYAQMEARKRSFSERMREVSLQAKPGIRYGSLAQDAVVGALREHGPLTRHEILERMVVKFKNARSLDLALQNMEKRGIVRLVRDSDGSVQLGAKKSRLWEVVRSAVL